MKKIIPFYLAVIFFFGLSSCEKDIDVKIPESENKLVVEGWIEQGLPPFVILTKSASYFEKSDLTAFQNSFVHGAIITVSDGTTSVELTEFCSQNYSDAELMIIAGAIGISFETLKSVNYCLYSTFSGFQGAVGKNYSLKIVNDGKTYTSSTQIPNLVPLDSVWFKIDKGYEDKGLGYIYGHMTDPDTLGNAYRWSAKREGKDDSFGAPLGASFNDKLINGKSFEFGYDRPRGNNPDDPDEKEPYGGHYKMGDTIIIKFTTMDDAHFQFRTSYENYLASNGNPFASPTNIKTNILGGALGVWGGFGVSYDTIYGR